MLLLIFYYKNEISFICIYNVCFLVLSAGMKQAIAEAVAFHVEGMQAEGDEVAAWLADGDYQFEWVLEISAPTSSHFLQKINRPPIRLLTRNVQFPK